MSEFESQYGQESSLLHVIQAGSGALLTMDAGGKACQSIKLTIRLRLVLRSRECGPIHPLSHVSSCHSV
jgi:hypothetical protein